MHKLYVYQIGVKGEMDETAFNLTSPLQITDLEVSAAGTQFTTFTDQSGLIGLLRHLHTQGFILLFFRSTDIQNVDTQERSIK